jgi:uncharacterized Tic20 family protein
VDEQGKEALNFQITMFIYFLVAALLCFACIGFGLTPAVVIVDVVFIIVAAVKTNDGYHYRYPRNLIFRFIKWHRRTESRAEPQPSGAVVVRAELRD